MQTLINQFSLNPKQLFLIDGIGALVSAFLLGVVLVQLESIFGIPKNTLYFLAILPCAFALYDFYCYWKVQKQLAFYLSIIAFVNLAYCFLSIGVAIYHRQKLSYWGWAYILAEVAIVLLLVNIELRTAAQISTEE